jgi:hypothetical protein
MQLLRLLLAWLCADLQLLLLEPHVQPSLLASS